MRMFFTHFGASRSIAGTDKFAACVGAAKAKLKSN